MRQIPATPVELKVLMNHIYEYQKGVRQMILFTCSKEYESFVIQRLERQNINFVVKTTLTFISGARNVSMP